MADMTLFEGNRASEDTIFASPYKGVQSSTSYELLDGDGVLRLIETGVNFNYLSQFGFLFRTSGTITSSFFFSSNGQPSFQVINSNIDVAIRDTLVPSGASGYNYVQYALRGNDNIIGSADNDRLYGSKGNDIINGETGIDVLSFNKFGSGVTVNLATGNAITSSGTSLISNIEDIEGSGYNDTLTGDTGNNQIQGFGGADTINGGIGFDTAVYFDATSAVNVNLATGVVTGGSGNDTLISIERIIGSRFNDTLVGSITNETFLGGLGNDTINGAGGIDTVEYDFVGSGVTVNLTTGLASGGGGNDIISNVENIKGSIFNDILTGNNLVNVLNGGNGNDILDGGGGNDILNGGLGSDTYIVDAVDDVVIETSTLATEIDTIKSSVNNTLVLNVEKLTLTGAGNINGTGNTLDNTIVGNTGNNILDGGAGKDTLSGGAGADTFVFQFGQSLITGVDRITDFTIGTDKIDLRTQTGLAMSAPTSFTRATNSTAISFSALANQVFLDANGAIANNQALGVNSAALVQVTSGGIAGTYIAINDGIAGFQSGSDTLINITGYSGTLPALGAITPVSSWFA
jgi:Ca2+-binding RTX toxin-like protein